MFLTALIHHAAPTLSAALLALTLLGDEAGHDQHAAAARAEAQALLDAGEHRAAAEAYAALTDAHPDDALAWHNLGLAHHLAGEYAAAHAAARRGAALPGYRESALYNMACASTQLGELERAEDELRRAVDAGFVDFDLMASDADLEALRAAGRAPLPREHVYETLRHGGVTIPYTVLLPDDHDPARAYPAALVFSPGGMGKRSTDASLDTLWADADARAGWIVVCAAQPSNGWMNHPAHHALNALMKQVLRTHEIVGERFQLVGLDAGGRPAATYASMSHQFVRGLTLVDSRAFTRWDADEIRSLGRRALPTRLFVRADDGALLDHARDVAEQLEHAGGDARVELVETDGPSLRALDARRLLGTPVSPARTSD